MNAPAPAVIGKVSVFGKILVVALFCTMAVACSKKVKEAPPADTGTTTQPTQEQPPATTGVYGPEDLDTDACLRQRVIYFDFDQDALRPEFQAAMACHAKYLRDRPSSRMSLEGNADERGSREYNVGLGERRGNAVSSALQANGGSGSQITVVSYGEERPTCNESTEDCWAKNRRVEIVYTAK
jgi:peptidoglycan-associated lipoprotein